MVRGEAGAVIPPKVPEEQVMGRRELARKLSGLLRKQLQPRDIAAVAKLYMELRGWKGNERLDKDDETANAISRLERLEREQRKGQDNGQ